MISHYMLMPIDYAQITSTEDQRPTTTTPTQITLNQNDSISGIEHSAESPGTIRIQDSGIYVIIAAHKLDENQVRRIVLLTFG